MKTKQRKFTYAYDVKREIIDRHSFTVTADSQEHADALALDLVKNGSAVNEAWGIETLHEYTMDIEPRPGEIGTKMLYASVGWKLEQLWSNAVMRYLITGEYEFPGGRKWAVFSVDIRAEWPYTSSNGEVLQVQRLDDIDHPLKDDEQAWALARKRGYTLDENGIVIGYNGSSFVEVL